MSRLPECLYRIAGIMIAFSQTSACHISINAITYYKEYMNLRPQPFLTAQEVNSGMKLVLLEGLTTEAMTVLTQGAFLISMALLMGASNFQIGLLAALPTFTNIFQLASIWLVRRYNNRRAVSVFCSLLARLPLVLTGLTVILGVTDRPIHLIIIFLFIYYLFASISGPSWNAWMKDLVPENKLGTYFSRRGRNAQILNVVMSLVFALAVDYIKRNYPGFESTTYGVMYVAGGLIGVTGVLLLSRTPEPQSFLSKENIFVLLKRPLVNPNFRRLLTFNSAWVFALNIATPFFTVFMMKSLGLSLPYVIGLTITSQLCSISTIRIWGSFSDHYSNKTILAICGPLYILCILGWCFVGIYSQLYANIILLVIIHIFMGIATAGINLSLTNIGLKLAPKEDAIVYLSAKNIITSLFSFTAPLVGGILADYFTTRHLNITAEWKGPGLNKVFHFLSLNEWNFLFLIGSFLAFIAMQLLTRVKEVGEVEKDVVVRIMRSSIKNNLKDNFVIGNLINWHTQLRDIIRKRISVKEE